MKTRWILAIGLGLLTVGCSKDRCASLEPRAHAYWEKNFEEALAVMGEAEAPAVVEPQIAKERRMSRKNFAAACKTLPSDFDADCLLSKENAGCEAYAEKFYAVLYEE